MGAGHTDAARVNIVMRTRNRALLLARALDDVLAQSFDDWSLTIVNDGGDAAPVDALVAARRAAFGERVAVIHHAESAGMEAASNVGVNHRSSDYVAIHDDDDTWARDFLATTVAWLDDHAAAPAVAVRTEIVWEGVSEAGVRELDREVFLPEIAQVTLIDLLRFNTSVPISMLYRRTDLVEVGLFNESLSVVGDWECNLRLAMRGQIGFIDGVARAFWHQRRRATGDLGNSVIALRDEHQRFDRQVRDEALRSYVAGEGSGLVLYLGDRFREMERQLDRIEAAIERRPINVIRRQIRRIRRDGLR